jgi:hypothetical protein
VLEAEITDEAGWTEWKDKISAAFWINKKELGLSIMQQWATRPGQGGARSRIENSRDAIEVFEMLVMHRPHNLFVINKLVDCFRDCPHPRNCVSCFSKPHSVPSWSPSTPSMEERCNNTLTVCAALCCPAGAPSTLKVTQKRRLQILPQGKLQWERKKTAKAFCSVVGCDNNFAIFASRRASTGQLTTGEHHCRFCGTSDTLN